MLGDERRADASAEADEEHAPAVVAPERLHRGVVHHANGLAERFREVEAHPAVAEIAGLGAGPRASTLPDSRWR